MSLRSLFQPTLDLPGVLGAFCLSNEAELIESFLRLPYTDAIFKELGPRCLTLLNAVDMSYTQTNEYLLRFEENSLYLHKNETGIVGVLCTGNPMLAGLRVSTNLLLKTANDAILNAPVKGISGAAAPVQEKVSAFDDGDDLVITPKKQRETLTEAIEAPERKSFFGSKKAKKSKPSNDIWG